MSALDDYLSEHELAEQIKAKVGYGSRRTLRKWREQRVGPPSVKFRNVVIYPAEGYKTWLHNQVQHPIRKRV